MNTEAKLAASIGKYRQRLRNLQAAQRTTQLLGPSDTEVFNEGRRLRVETCARSVVDMDTEDEELPLCTYPMGRGAITLTQVDVDRLQPERFLNDQLINLLLKWQCDQVVPQRLHGDVMVLDSMAYAQLTKGVDRAQVAEVPATLKANVERVVNWYRRHGELRRSPIIVPVCEDNHWLLVVAVNSQVTDVTQVIIMDSIATVSRPHVSLIVSSLLDHAFTTPRRFLVVRARTTQQTNGYDCGVHVVHNATEFLRCASSESEVCLTAVERGLAKPMLTRAALRAIITEIATVNPKRAIVPTVVEPQVVATQPMDVDRQPSQQQQQQQQAPELRFPQQGASFLSAGQQCALAEGIDVLNGGQEVWELTTTLGETLVHIVQDARVEARNAKQRRVIFRRRVEDVVCRFQLTKGSLRCLITKMTQPQEQ